MSLYDEPRQQKNTGHILGDNTSKVWREVEDDSTDKVTLVLKCISWCCFSSIVFKLVRIISVYYSSVFISIALFIVLAPLSMLLYAYLKSNERKFNAMVWFAIVVLGLTIGWL